VVWTRLLVEAVEGAVEAEEDRKDEIQGKLAVLLRQIDARS
jgi:hypothetical protein